MSIEEKYDEVQQLIAIGKEKGYLLYDDVNEVLPVDLVLPPRHPSTCSLISSMISSMSLRLIRGVTRDSSQHAQSC